MVHGGAGRFPFQLVDAEGKSGFKGRPVTRFAGVKEEGLEVFLLLSVDALKGLVEKVGLAVGQNSDGEEGKWAWHRNLFAIFADNP